MKKLLIFALALLCLLLCACGDKSAYVNDVASNQVADAMVTAIGTAEDYMSGDADLYDFYFGEQEAYAKVKDCNILFSRLETDVNEIGVFRASSEQDVEAVRAMVQAYLNDQTSNLRSFAANYSPADMAKIDNAGVEVYGVYVVYYILDAEDETAALDAIKELLVK